VTYKTFFYEIINIAEMLCSHAERYPLCDLTEHADEPAVYEIKKLYHRMMCERENSQPLPPEVVK